MAFVSPAEARATFEDGPGGLQVTIPGARRRFLTLFLLVWLGGWFFGERSALDQLTSGTTSEGRGFLVLWLIGWTLGGVAVAYLILWTTLGHERLILRPDALVLRREVLGVGRSREYDIRHVKDLRVATSPGAFDYRHSLQFWGLGGGRVAFDYGARTVYFASAIDEAEAKLLVDRLRSRNHLLQSPGAA
jgi:hypothetical protein